MIYTRYEQFYSNYLSIELKVQYEIVYSEGQAFIYRIWIEGVDAEECEKTLENMAQGFKDEIIRLAEDEQWQRYAGWEL